jgi:hypothetical protein
MDKALRKIIGEKLRELHEEWDTVPSEILITVFQVMLKLAQALD